MGDDSTVDHRRTEGDPLATIAQGGSGGGRTFDVRCPHCRSTIQVPAEASLASISCYACGSQFDLINDAATTWAAPAFMTLGRFELIDKLGAGNFGSVWKARDRELDRTVAIKTPRQGAMTGPEMEKFFREARAAAQLRHPNIVSVHEVGRDGDSVYIVSDLVRGVTLHDWLTGQRPTGREAAELCATIAEALHHAHEQGVVHRDLKPGNVMIDGDGEPHLMDFGLARRVTGEVTMTADGHILGTPAYMSPEQAVGESHTADRRSDVYSLGVILFELLTAELPFRGNSRMMIHQVINEEPPSPRKFNSAVPRDLETIALKCMEKKPERRFQSAAEVAAELRRYLAGEPILSRPLTKAGRAWRWAKRKPVVAGLSAAVALLLSLVAVAGPVIALREAAQRQAAEEGEQKAVGLRENAERSEERARAKEAEAKQLADAETAARKAAEAAQRDLAATQEASERRVYARTISLAQQEWENANIVQCEDLLEGTRGDLRGWEWEYLKHLCHAEQITLMGLRSAPQAVCLHKDGVHAAAFSGSEGTLFVWDRRTGQLEGRHKLAGITFNRDGTRMAGYAAGAAELAKRLASGVLGGNVFSVGIFDVLTGEKISDLVGHKMLVTAVDFSADGAKAATSSLDDTVRIWDVQTGKQIVEISDPDILDYKVALSPDGSRVSWWDLGIRIVVHDASTGEKLSEMHDPFRGMGWLCLEFNPDGSLLATAERDQISLWQVDGGKRLHRLHGHRGVVMDLNWSANGKLLASAGYDETARLWDVNDGRELLRVRGHKGGTDYGITSVALSSDDAQLITGGADMAVKIWDAKVGDPLPEEIDADMEPGINPARLVSQMTPDLRQDVDWVYGQSRNVRDLDFTPDGRQLVAASEGGGITIIDVATRKRQRSFKGHDGPVAAACFSPDGKNIASGSGGFTDAKVGTILVWSAENGEILKTLKGHDYPISNLRFAKDGSRIFSGSGSWARPDSGELIAWDAANGQQLWNAEGIKSAVIGLDLAPDQQVVATCGEDGRVRFWDADSGQHLRDLGQMGEAFFAVAYSPDGKTIAAAGKQWSVTLFDVATGGVLWKRFEHSGEVWDVSFAGPKRLVSASKDGSTRMWDVDSGDCLLAFRDSASDMYCVRMSPDGRTLASSGGEPRISLRSVPASGGRAGQWQVLVHDDFEGGDLGANWNVVNGTWTVENGVARGTFGPEREAPAFFAATLEAKTPLPANVEVSFETWSQQQVDYEIKLHKASTQRSLIAVLIGTLGSSFNRGERGYTIVTQAGESNFQESCSRRGEVAPGRKYKLRGVRSGGRWRMYVDEQLMLESDAAEDLALPELRIQGSHGARGDVVFIDNIEIRTPVEAAPKSTE